jgi:hypothetical protein
MLAATSVGNTNLIELTARGPDKHLLPMVINTWIDVYLDAHDDAHMLFLDGVFVDGVNGSARRFRWVKAPTRDELTQLTLIPFSTRGPLSGAPRAVGAGWRA